MIGLEETLIRKLRTAGLGFLTVESCTGGLIAHRMTNVPGASSVFWGSFGVYDNSAKVLLGVSPQLLVKHGAVSAAVAKSLAEQGLLKVQGAPLEWACWKQPPSEFWCLSSSGIAGPGGGSLEKPVGLCYLGLARTGQCTLVQEVQVPGGDRLSTKEAFAEAALQWVRKLLFPIPSEGGVHGSFVTS